MLREIEAAFRAGTLGGDAAAAEALVNGQGITAEDRVGIYANNVVGSLIEVLENTYPAIRRHVGEENFAVLARGHVTQTPPQRPQLDLYGEGFADHVAGFAPARENLPWLPDLARLEWAYHAAYFAADAPVFDPTSLGDLAPERFGDLRFALHPATRVIGAGHPIFGLWQAETLADVRDEGYDVLVTRPDVDVAVAPVSAGTRTLASGLAAGNTLSAAAEQAAQDDAEFDLQATLGVLISAGAFSAGGVDGSD